MTGHGGAEARRRPEVHFTPPANWLNDPNGLVVLDGVYHLFYQHNPETPVWGNLHWGHATSTDLLHWDHQPVALAPDEIGQIYSGTAVVDHDDTAGFGAGAVVAVFTHAAADGQHQSLAVSTDGGTTWTKHAGNPVLRSPDGLRDFRDPKVLRWTGADGGGGGAGGERWWAMVLAVGSELWLYRSDDLQTWSRSSTLALLDPAEPTVLEVPELVRVPVEGTSRPDEAGGAWRWVLIVSVLPGGPEAEPRWVGWLPVTFDGLTVTPIGAPTLRRLDEGPDIYAPMAWDGDADDGSDGRAPILIGWMNEAEVPANGTAGAEPVWCGRMSIPRRLSLDQTVPGDALVQRPTHVAVPVDGSAELLEPGQRATIPVPAGATVLLLRAAAGPIGVRCLVPTAAGTPRTIDVDGASVLLDGPAVDGDRPPDGSPDEGRAELLLDAGSVEVFAGGGRCVASLLTGRSAASVDVVNTSAAPLHVTVARPVAERRGDRPCR